MDAVLVNEHVEDRLQLLRRLVQVTLVLTCLDTAAVLLNIHSWRTGGGTILWPSNGLLVGVLLCTPKRQWPAYLMVGFTVDLGINVLFTFVSWTTVYITCCNTLEVVIAAFLLYKTIAPQPDLTQRRQLVSLLLYGVVLAPAIASLAVQLNSVVTHVALFFLSFSHWFTADALGMAVMVPLYLSFAQEERFSKRSRLEIAGLLGLLIVTATYVFWQTRFPFLFLVLPVLLLLGMRLRLAGSALGLLIVSIIGGYFTIIERGPVALAHASSINGRELLLQFFVAVSMLVLYVIEVVISERERLQDNLQASETRFRLLAEASKDMIILSDLFGRRRYVSPAVTPMLGWEPSELVGQTFRQVVHPEDAAGVAEMLSACRDGKFLDAFAYRCLKKDGSYLWVEASVRLCTDETGEPVGFVKVARDISSRKAAEEELNRAFRMVENMAMVDGLTGVANRRRFEDTLDQEWRRAMRDGSTLSLLMIDVDHFKSYNDLYGHVLGDSCLRQVATAVQEVLHRSSDLFARYGGEEFAVVLPNTDIRGAERLAEQMRDAVERLQLPHGGSSHGIVTISIGCAAGTFAHDSVVTALVEAADHALYQAKSAGRNRIEVADRLRVAN